MLDNFQLHELSGYTGLERINYLLEILINSKTYYDYVLNSYEQKDYEKNHPGWIVVAGINGDQYYAKYGSQLGVDGSFYYYNQPYYPMIIDGERRFPITATGYSDRNYVGVTNNIERGVLEHRTPDTKSFTTRYHCHKLVYYEEYSSIDEAISREKQIKSWSRSRKDKMIDFMNPDRKDLMPQIATSLRSSQ